MAPVQDSGSAATRAQEGPSGFQFGGERASRAKARRDLLRAYGNAAICAEYARIRAEEGLSGNQAAAKLGRALSQFSGENSLYARWQRGGVAGLMPRPRAGGCKTSALTSAIEGLPWFLPACQVFYLARATRRVWGAALEAVRRAISLPRYPRGWAKRHRSRFLQAIGCQEMPTCPPDLKEAMLARVRSGKPIVTQRVLRSIARSEPVTTVFIE